MTTGVKAWRRLAGSWAGLGAAWVVLAVAGRVIPGVAEVWAAHVYPAWSNLIVPISERASWPWTPWVLAGLVTLAGVTARGVASRRWAVAAWLALVATLGGAFETSWGWHAEQPPVERRLSLSAGPVDEADLETMATRLHATLVASVPVGDLDEEDALASLQASMRTFAPDVRVPSRVKHVAGVGFGTLGVAGVISPWTLEVHVDAGLPAWSRVAVAAHELAHIAGFESEAGAELVGLLAGLRAEHADARYAAALRAWTWLPWSVREGFSLPERTQRDLEALDRAAARRDDRLTRWAWSLYARYLTSRGQGEGTAGYARGVTLLVEAQRAGLW